jgi:hypothetical protein
MSKIFDRALKLIRAATNAAKTRDGKCRCEEIHLCTDYAEPGYTSREECIAFGNWNTITKWTDGKSEVIDNTPKRLGDALERLGVDLEWSDEWAFCSSCGKAVRTQADSYSWKRSYTEDDGDITCEDCINPAEYLEGLEGHDDHCATIDSIDPGQHDYRRLALTFEHGFHPGQDADPKKIGAALRKMGVSRYLFVLDSTGQFDIAFSVWVHTSEIELVKAFDESKLKCDVSPSDALQKGLREATVQMAKIQDGQGVKHASIDGEGNVEVRLISPEDFVSGKAFKKGK